MPTDTLRPRSAGRWLAVAKGDLAMARRPREPEVPWELLAFHAQQAAEKALKSVLIMRGVRPPKTHDLADLVHALQEKEFPVPPNAEKLADLSAFAVEARYPGAGFEEVTEDDYRGALELALAVVGWAEKIIGGSG